MKTAILFASLYISALSLDAQITTTMNPRPDGTTEIRLRNTSTATLAAFAISVSYSTRAHATNDPLIVWVDPALDPFRGPTRHQSQLANRPLLPNQEFTWLPERMLVVTEKSGKPLFEQPIAAAIFADGTTAGNAALLTRLMDRRINMLLAVDIALETLLDAGKPDTTRDRLISQFRTMADSTRRWYLPPEQKVGLGLYQSIAGKLMYLPDERIGSLHDPGSFVARQAATLNQQRVALLALLESQPGPTYWTRLGP